MTLEELQELEYNCKKTFEESDEFCINFEQFKRVMELAADGIKFRDMREMFTGAIRVKKCPKCLRTSTAMDYDCSYCSPQIDPKTGRIKEDLENFKHVIKDDR